MQVYQTCYHAGMKREAKVQVLMQADGRDVLAFWANIETDVTKTDVARNIMRLVSCQFWPMLVDNRVVTADALALYCDGKLSTIRGGDRIIVDDLTFRYGANGLELAHD